MNRSSRWNPRLGPLSAGIVLLVLHAVLKEILARFDIVSCVFAAGDHVPRWMIGCAMAFTAVRLALFLLVPAMLAWWLTAAAVRRRMRCRQ